MSTHITFFDLTTKERQSFEHFFESRPESVKYFSEPIQEVPVYEYKDSTVISVYITSKVDEKVLSHMPKLKLISCRSTGYDNVTIPPKLLDEISVCNVPGYGETTVAEYATMLMLSLARKLPQVLDSFRSGEIDYPHLTGFTLSGKTLGVVGTGKIGLAVIRIASAMGMKVLAFDPFEKTELQQTLGFTYVSLKALLAGADIVSLHAPLTKTNLHLINEQTLQLMKPRAFLINTARGELVDTKALVEALRNHRLGGAALDVMEGEQVIELDHEIELFRTGKKSIDEQVAEHDILSKMKNVILSPHNAFNSAEALGFIRKITFENIVAYLEDNPRNVIKF